MSDIVSPMWAADLEPAILLHSGISRTRSRSALRGLAFSDHPDGRTGSVLQLPHPLLVLRHAIPVILESVVAPFAAYYCVLLICGFRWALLSALAWSYFLVGRRIWRHERVSTMLMLGTALLTVRTIVSFLTGSAFVYFIQPTVSAFLASFLLVITALAGRPFTQRFTHDFCPLTPELLARPSVHRFFIRVSFLWAVTVFLNGAIVLTLLFTASTRSFPPERLGATLSVTATAIFLSITWFARSMRNDGVTVRFVGSQALTRLSQD
ncbi:MAG TPA: VC0807 family protein [Acidimicrobiales bacterium]|nr:VC0807 family protein [Acidimicrobiales bacterium]